MTHRPQETTHAGTRDELPLRLHHNASVCADQERTFAGRKLAYSYTFFGIGDGGALAFFQFADPEAAAAYKAKRQPLFVHIALAVTEAVQERIRQRLIDANAAHEALRRWMAGDTTVNNDIRPHH